MRRRISGGLVLALALAAGPAAAQSHSDLQERYCTGDAFRLCSSEIPNEERIIACMNRQKQALSPACRAVFDDPPPTSVARAKPVKPKPLTTE